MLEEAVGDVLAFMRFPVRQWSRLCSTNPRERQNREIAQRTDAVSILPNRAALLRLVTARLHEQHEEWLTERRYAFLGTLSEVSDGIALPVQATLAA